MNTFSIRSIAATSALCLLSVLPAAASPFHFRVHRKASATPKQQVMKVEFRNSSGQQRELLVGDQRFTFKGYQSATLYVPAGAFHLSSAVNRRVSEDVVIKSQAENQQIVFN